MELVDRYLKAVAKALPEAQREDIIRELSEDIHSEMEDKQSELGRSLTAAEQESLLKQRGNPLLLAARYRQDHRSLVIGRPLIGPVLFPFYVKVLCFNLGITILVTATIFVALSVSGQNISFNQVFSICLLQLLIQLGVVTLIFSLVQRHLTKNPDRWDLSGARGGLRLDLKTEKNVSLRLERGTPQVSRFDSVSIIVASVVALVWLTEVQKAPFLILGPAAAFLKLAPIWYQVYFPIVLLTVAEIVRAVINLFRPDWTRFRSVFSIGMHCAGLALIYFLLKGGSWVVPVDSTADGGSQYAHAAGIVNQWIRYSLVLTAAFVCVMLVLRIIRLVRALRRQTGTPNVGAAAKAGN